MAGHSVGGLPFGWGAIGAIMGIINALGLGAIIVAWIKSRAPNRKIEVDADEKLRSEMWRDIAALKVSKEETGRRLTMAETKIASQTVEIGQLRFISKLVVDEIERLDPGNSIARQARILLETVQPAAMPNDSETVPLAEGILRLSRVRGVGE